jgi:hypothetical protein
VAGSSSSPVRTKEAVGDDPLDGGGGAADVEVQLDGVEGGGVGDGGGPGLGFGEMGSLYLRWRLRRCRSTASTETGVAAPAPPGLEEAEARGGVPYSASSSESERSRSSRLCEPPIAAAAIRVSTRETKREGSVREFEIWEWCVGSGAAVAVGFTVGVASGETIRRMQF